MAEKGTRTPPYSVYSFGRVVLLLGRRFFALFVIAPGGLASSDDLSPSRFPRKRQPILAWRRIDVEFS